MEAKHPVDHYCLNLRHQGSIAVDGASAATHTLPRGGSDCIQVSAGYHAVSRMTMACDESARGVCPQHVTVDRQMTTFGHG